MCKSHAMPWFLGGVKKILGAQLKLHVDIARVVGAPYSKLYPFTTSIEVYGNLYLGVNQHRCGKPFPIQKMFCIQWVNSTYLYMLVFSKDKIWICRHSRIKCNGSGPPWHSSWLQNLPRLFFRDWKGNSTSVKERKVHVAMFFSISRFIEITVSNTR